MVFMSDKLNHGKRDRISTCSTISRETVRQDFRPIPQHSDLITFCIRVGCCSLLFAPDGPAVV